MGMPERACLPMGPILLHKTGHCRSAGSSGCSRRGRGCSSGVEHHVANVRVVGSNPIARSNDQSVQSRCTYRSRSLGGRRFSLRGRARPCRGRPGADGCGGPASLGASASAVPSRAHARKWAPFASGAPRDLAWRSVLTAFPMLIGRRLGCGAIGLAMAKLPVAGPVQP
jgi:hypothetical protein